MIVTKSWLNEWVDLEDKSTDDICETLNQIGLEVDSVKSFKIPDNIIIGFVLECEKHPEADKLNVCQVDVGTGTRQIVCGASNVRAGIYVPVAMIGAVMPSGLEIKPVKLRGVDSDGMICSSGELDLPTLCEGILILDDSIGELKAGEPLGNYDCINEDVIEIELTANRGDCLSHIGVARDLAAAYGKTLKKKELKDSDYRRQGSTRLIHLTHQNDIEADVIYKSFEYEPFLIPLKYRYRLTLCDESYEHSLEGMMLYTTLSTGVILCTYNHDFFTKDEETIAEIFVHQDDKGLTHISGQNDASIVGTSQVAASKVKHDGEKVILEASYIDPEVISRQVYEQGLKTDTLYYRTSRGSDPDIEHGIAYCSDLLMRHCGIDIFPGTFAFRSNYQPSLLNLDICSMNALIGDTIAKTEIVKILTTLGFDILKSQGDNLVVNPPRFRHDMKNEQDVVEEIVRMVGIDNIKAKPLEFTETNAYNPAYEAHTFKRNLRSKAATAGFFETVSYLFSQRDKVEKYGFKAILKKLELVNPIVDTMDTLRPTMHIAHIEAAGQNMNLGQKRVPLFEYGTIFGAHREESTVLSFIYSGVYESESVTNQGKPPMIDLEKFTQKVADVIGDFTLAPCEPSSELMHPYQSALVMVDDQSIGTIFKLHPKVGQEYDLPDTFLAQIEVDKLSVTRKQAKAYSKYQSVQRDISVVAPKNFMWASIQRTVEKLQISTLTGLELIDIYEDEKLEDQASITLRFTIQSLEKTLKDKEINSVMKSIIDTLEKKLGFKLR